MAKTGTNGIRSPMLAIGEVVQIATIKADNEKIARSIEAGKLELPAGVEASRVNAAYFEYAALQGEEDSVVWRRAVALTFIAPTFGAVERATDSYRALYTAGGIPRMPEMPSRSQHSQWTNAVSTAKRLGIIPADGFDAIDMSKGGIKSWSVPEALAACSLRRAYEVDGWLRKLADVLVEPNTEAITTLYKRIGSAKGTDLARLNGKMRENLAGDVTDAVREKMLESVNMLFTDEGWATLALPPSNDELSRRRNTAIRTAAKLKEEHAALSKELDNLRAGVQRVVDRGETPTDEQRKAVEELAAKVEELEERHDKAREDFIAAEGKRADAPKLVAARANGKRDGYDEISLLTATAKRFRETFEVFNDEAKNAGLPPRTESEFVNVLLDSFAQSRGEKPAEWSKAYANYMTIREHAKEAPAN